jgi:hypothetical protein
MEYQSNPTPYFQFHEQLRGYHILYNGKLLDKAQAFHFSQDTAIRQLIADRSHPDFYFYNKHGWKDGILADKYLLQEND